MTSAPYNDAHAVFTASSAAPQTAQPLSNTATLEGESFESQNQATTQNSTANPVDTPGNLW